MPVIKLKLADPSNSVQHILTVFHAMTGFDLTYWRKEGDTLAVFVTSEKHVEFVMTADVRASLAKEGMQVIKTEEYLANSTLIAKDVPRSLQERSTEDIASDISSCNEVVVVSVDWKGEDTLFIEFNTIEDATKVLNSPEGMKLSYERSITRLTKKPYMKIPQCPRCFSFEHESDSCPKTVRTCYHCGEEGHAGEECSTSYVRCANCRGDHVAFAFKCPVRKQKEREMKEDGFCSPDTVDGSIMGRDDKEEDEEESTKRAEEEVSIILGVDKLLLEDPDQCDFLQASTSPTERSPKPDNQTSTPSVTREASDSPQKTPTEATTGDLPGDPLESGHSPVASGTRGLQRSPCRTSPRGKIEDPLPVSPRRTSYPEDRPPSRLGDPLAVPLLRPVVRRSPVKSSVSLPTGEIGDVHAAKRTSTNVSEEN